MKDSPLSHVDEWVSNALISPDQAAAIQEFELSRKAASEGVSVPAAGEIAGYVGGALALAALTAIVGQFWFDLSELSQPAFAIVVSSVCLVGGLLVSRIDSAQALRLGGFLFFLATAGFGFSANLIADWGYHDSNIARTAGTFTAAVVAYVVWFRYKTGLQVVAMALATGSFIAAGPSLLRTTYYGTTLGWAFLIVGILWLLLAERGAITPRTPALVMGSITVLVGPQVLVSEVWERPLGYLVLGIVVSTGLLLVGLRLQRGVTLGFGAAGIVIFVPQVLYDVFPESIAAPVALLVAGVLLIGMSALLIHRKSALRGANKRIEPTA